MHHYYSIKVFWIWLYTYFYQWVLTVHMLSCWLPGMWWVFSFDAFKFLYLSLPFKNLITMCLREVLFMFNLFGILWSLWITMLISLYSFEISSVIISLNMICVSFSSSETLSFETPRCLCWFISWFTKVLWALFTSLPFLFVVILLM